jgi:hypothetical protein
VVMGPKTIEAIYRMSHEQKLSHREISRQLGVARKTILKYLENPLGNAVVRKPRRSKLDSFKPVIRELLDQCPRASSVVIAQRIRPLGYTGGRSILQEYVATLRRVQQPPRAYVRVESSPGDCFQIDWGHFGAIDYQGDRRKLYVSLPKTPTKRARGRFAQLSPGREVGDSDAADFGPLEGISRRAFSIHSHSGHTAGSEPCERSRARSPVSGNSSFVSMVKAADLWERDPRPQYQVREGILGVGLARLYSVRGECGSCDSKRNRSVVSCGPRLR